MFDEIKNIKEDNSNCKSKKGFQITVKNLDTGETIFDSKTNAIIGAYAVGAEGGGNRNKRNHSNIVQYPYAHGNDRRNRQSICRGKEKGHRRYAAGSAFSGAYER